MIFNCFYAGVYSLTRIGEITPKKKFALMLYSFMFAILC